MARSYAVSVAAAASEAVPFEFTNVVADPTGGSITFEFEDASTTTQPSTFGTSGTWGTYDSTNLTVTATCPGVGGAGAANFNLSSASRWRAYAKFTVGSETIVRLAGYVDTY